MRKIILFFAILFILPLISASCNEGQIDINSASLEKMMKIKWLGGTGVTAQKVIDARPFNSLDDLTKVSGIAEGKLADIKNQGFACVNENEQENKEENTKKLTDEIGKQAKTDNLKTTEEKLPYNKTLSLITLTKDIKSDNNLKLNKNDYAIYGFIVFCILLAFLFIIKKRRYNENEFN